MLEDTGLLQGLGAVLVGCAQNAMSLFLSDTLAQCLFFLGWLVGWDVRVTTCWCPQHGIGCVC